jgi:hypothetical protein
MHDDHQVKIGLVLLHLEKSDPVTVEIIGNKKSKVFNTDSKVMIVFVSILKVQVICLLCCHSSAIYIYQSLESLQYRKVEYACRSTLLSQSNLQ